MKNSDKIKIEIDLLRDSLRNIFVVMFSLVTALIGLGYKIVHKFSYIDLFFVFLGICALFILIKIKYDKIEELNKILKILEEC